MRAFTVLVFAAALFACANVHADAPSTRATQPLNSSRLISAEELGRRYHDGNLLDALRALRPRFLVARGPDHTREPVVYLDGIPLLGGLADLAGIRVDAVAEVKYLTASEATTLYGSGHLAGAIVVTSIKGPARERQAL